MWRLIPRLVLALAVGIFALNVADYLLTIWMLRLGGIEVNPLMAPIVDTPLLPILKIVGVGVVCVFAALVARSKFAVRMMAFVVAYYVAVVGWNAGSLYLFYN